MSVVSGFRAAKPPEVQSDNLMPAELQRRCADVSSEYAIAEPAAGIVVDAVPNGVMYRSQSRVRLVCRLFEVGALVLVLQNVTGVGRFVAGVEWNDGDKVPRLTRYRLASFPGGLVGRRLADEPPRECERKTDKLNPASSSSGRSAQNFLTTASTTFAALRFVTSVPRSGAMASERFRDTILKHPGDPGRIAGLRGTRSEIPDPKGVGSGGQVRGPACAGGRPGQRNESTHSAREDDPLERTSREFPGTSLSGGFAVAGPSRSGGAPNKLARTAPLRIVDARWDPLQLLQLVAKKKLEILHSRTSHSLRRLLAHDQAGKWTAQLILAAIRERNRRARSSQPAESTGSEGASGSTGKPSEEGTKQTKKATPSVSGTRPAAPHPRQPVPDGAQGLARLRRLKKKQLVSRAPLFVEDDNLPLRGILDLVQKKVERSSPRKLAQHGNLRAALLQKIMIQKLDKVRPIVLSMEEAREKGKNPLERASEESPSTSAAVAMESPSTSAAAATKSPSSSVTKRKREDDEDGTQ